MQAHIAQASAICIYGNEFLRGHRIGAFWPAASVFRSCEQVAFVVLPLRGAGLRVGTYAEDPLAWYAKLQAEGVIGLRLHYVPQNTPDIPDRITAAFAGGGGRWLLEAVKPGGSDIWQARWEIGNREDPQRRIWRVTYGRTEFNHSTLRPQQVEEERLRDELMEVLTSISEFAKAERLDPFVKSFQAGLEVLSSESPLKSVYHSDLAPAGALSLRSEQLLAAAQGAWVFGGMGSWNDVVTSGQLYEQLSDRLFTLLTRAIVEGTNRSFEG